MERMKKKRTKLLLQSDYDKWIKMSERLREGDVTRMEQLKTLQSS